MPALTANHLHKAFGPQLILDEVSLAIEPGERVGLIGSNGSGKSTLGKILVGLEPTDSGTLALRRGLQVAYLAQEPVLDPDVTAFSEVERGLATWRAATLRYESVTERLSRSDDPGLLTEQAAAAAEIERLGGWDQGHRVRAMLDHLGVTDLDRPVGTLSGGERRRVALARLLVSRPDFAVLDEPTNHLDAETAEWLEEHLVHEFPGALVLITHDRYFLDRVVTRVLELDRGQVTAFEGNYARYLEIKAERLEHEARTEANRLNVLRRERDWLSRSAPARTTKQKARIQRAESLEQTLQKSRRRTDSTEFELASVASGQRVLELSNVSVRLGDRTLFEGVNLSLGPGERIGIIGKNGAGKTTLLRAILGEITPSSGKIVLGERTRAMYFDQQRAGLEDDKTVFDNVSDGADKVRIGEEYVHVRSYLERFLFDASKQRQAVGTLSGGERARVALAKMLRGGANLVLLDEPTNDLDLVTLSTLEEMLTSFSGSAVVVTHDRYFLNRTATSILAFEPGGRVVRYAGNFDDYCLQRPTTSSAAARAPSPGASGPAARPPERKARTGLTMAEDKELAALPDRIDAAEKALLAVDAELADPGLYASRGGEVVAVQARRLAAQAELDALMARWEALEAKKAGSV